MASICPKLIAKHLSSNEVCGFHKIAHECLPISEENINIREGKHIRSHIYKVDYLVK